MKRNWRNALIVLTLVSGANLAAVQAPLIYPPSDPARDIEAALAAARRDGKHVLLDFGADWCPDCRVLGSLFEDSTVAPFAGASFHVVHVDVGRRDKNGELVAKYGATSDDWIPAVVVLDAEARAIGRTDDSIRLTRRTTPSQLLTILQNWSPKKVIAPLAAFTERGVAVAVRLEQDTVNQRWLAATFTPSAPETHLYAKDLPRDGVDGLGRPTTLAVVSGDGFAQTGHAIADRKQEDDRVEGLGTILKVYPAGPVTLRIPIAPSGTARKARGELSLTYMACGINGCLPPVIDKRVQVSFGW